MFFLFISSKSCLSKEVFGRDLYLIDEHDLYLVDDPNDSSLINEFYHNISSDLDYVVNKDVLNVKLIDTTSDSFKKEIGNHLMICLLPPIGINMTKKILMFNNEEEADLWFKLECGGAL